MRFERLTTTEDPRYTEAMELYRISFPFHEQRELDSQSQIMSHKDYQFLLIYDESQFVGLILCWETEQFIYVEHFCILPAMRNRKYGQKALELLNHRGKTVILEIDPPVDEVSIRRKSFYERVSFQANSYMHCHPAYHAGYEGHHLVVMSCPEPLSEAGYDAFDRFLKTVVMHVSP